MLTLFWVKHREWVRGKKLDPFLVKFRRPRRRRKIWASVDRLPTSAGRTHISTGTGTGTGIPGWSGASARILHQNVDAETAMSDNAMINEERLMRMMTVALAAALPEVTTAVAAAAYRPYER